MRFRINRRRTADISGEEDIRSELMAIALDGFSPMILMGGVCLVSATVLVAQYYGDSVLWWMALVCLIISGLRFWLVVALSRRTDKLTGSASAQWSAVFGVLTILFCSSVAFLTIYNFRFHDQASQVLCVLGTFTICSGLSSRIGLHPRISQACIIIMQGSVGSSLLLCKEPLIRYAAVLSLVTTFTYCTSIGTQHKLIEDQVRTRRKLRNLAHHDSLTGLENRHQFETRLKEACAGGMPFTLLMIDLDDFKQVNDIHGHAIGDEVLKQVARRLEKMVRKSDLVARLGGDEFVILLTEMHSVDTAHKLAKRIQREIAVPFEKDNRQIFIGASTGIKMAGAGENHPEYALIEADRALYRVKAGHQGGFEFV